MGWISDIITNISAFRIKVGEKLNWLNANKADTTALADFVKKDGSVAMTGTLVLNGSNAKAILKSISSVGNNFYSFQNSSGVLTHNIGLTGGNNNFDFYAVGNSDWQFYSNNNQILKINDNAVQAYRNVIVPDATANPHAVNLGQVKGLNDNFFEKRALTVLLNANTFQLGLFETGPSTANLPNPGYGVIYCYKAIANWFFQEWKDVSGNVWQRRAVNPATVNDFQSWIKINGNTSIDNYALISQVATEVTNQITNLQFAPEAHDYREITTNNANVNVSQFRRVVAVFSDPSVITVNLSNDAFPGAVVTMQTTSVLVNIKMDYRRPGSSGSTYILDAYRSLQVSFSEDLGAWIVEQENSLS